MFRGDQLGRLARLSYQRVHLNRQVEFSDSRLCQHWRPELQDLRGVYRAPKDEEELLAEDY